jgi:hypothetical protein
MVMYPKTIVPCAVLRKNRPAFHVTILLVYGPMIIPSLFDTEVPLSAIMYIFPGFLGHIDRPTSIDLGQYLPDLR